MIVFNELDINQKGFAEEFSSFLSQKNSIDNDLVNSVKDIISSIRKNGDESLRSLSLKYDNHDIKNFLMTEREIKQA
jgi:histidinol dehydrogenase